MSNTRDSIRESIFNRIADRQTKACKLLGAEIELRQPNVAEILALAQETPSVINILIQFAYVPGTETKVFEPADAEMLAQLPFSDEIRTLLDTFTSLSQIDVSTAEKN